MFTCGLDRGVFRKKNLIASPDHGGPLNGMKDFTIPKIWNTIQKLMKKIIFAVIMCTFGMSIQALENKKEVLQKPTGEYGVGFQDFHWVDQKNCPDIFYEKGKNEKDFSVQNRKRFCREIMARVYHPTNQTISKNNRSLYYPPVMNAQENFLKELKILALSNKKIETLSQIKSFTIKNANPMEGKNFPVLIFDPGSGVVVQLYENIIGNLVSHDMMI